MKTLIEKHETLPSTNERAKELAKEGAPHGTVVTANAQTAGKGRRGRSFFSPIGGLYMSVVLRDIKAPDMITPLAAVAVLEAIESLCNIHLGIKWVNDLYLNGKKICGILAQAREDFIILGIGVNLDSTLPDELSDIAASLNKNISKEALVSAILSHLERYLDGGKFLEKYRERSILTDKTVKVNSGDSCYTAFVKGIDDKGRLIVIKDGEEATLNSAEVSVHEQ